MTIEEKAREYADLKPDSNDALSDMLRSLAYKGYIEGAKWTLEKALDWIGDNVVVDKFGRPIDVENFRKTMEK